MKTIDDLTLKKQEAYGQKYNLISVIDIVDFMPCSDDRSHFPAGL